MDNAEQIKTQYGILGSAELGSTRKDHVDLSPILGEEATVPRKHIAKIVDARIGELFDMISNELKKPNGNYMLPAGLVLSGGGSNLAGMGAFAKDRLGLSVRIGGNYTLDGVSEEMRDPSYAVAVGLVMWVFERIQASGGMSRFSNQFSKNIFKKTGKW